MFKYVKKAKNTAVAFVKDNAPLIVPNIIACAAIVYVYTNETQKRTARYGEHLTEIETTFKETSDSWLSSQENLTSTAE